MRVAALYDVHGMRRALEAVLAEVDRLGVDEIVFGGDLVEGPRPQETLELARTVDAIFVRGNCERDPSEFVRGLLDESSLAEMHGWPARIVLDGVHYCHATPRSDDEIITEATPADRLEAALEGVAERLVVAGHTHMQVQRERYVNAGSVGMPYEDEVAAFWVVIEDGEPSFRRTALDVEAAVAELRSSGWPPTKDFIRENLYAAPSRIDAVEYFESRAGA